MVLDESGRLEEEKRTVALGWVSCSLGQLRRKSSSLLEAEGVREAWLYARGSTVLEGKRVIA